MRLAEITLTKQTVSGRDRLGQVTYTTASRDVIAEIMSQSRSEFFSAAQIGVSADIAFKLSQFDYDGELQLTYKGQNYRIYRKYEPDENYIELYAELTTGLNEAEEEDDDE